MHAAQKEFLEERYAAKDWHGRTGSGRRLVKEFQIEGLERKGWKLLKVKHSEQDGTKAIHSMWGGGDKTDELLSIDVFVSASVKAAHETLLEVLGNMQSGAIERKTEKTTPGDVAFGLANSVIVFARANVVVLVRNAGPAIVPVGVVARDLDAYIQRRLGSE